MSVSNILRGLDCYIGNQIHCQSVKLDETVTLDTDVSTKPVITLSNGITDPICMQRVSIFQNATPFNAIKNDITPFSLGTAKVNQCQIAVDGDVMTLHPVMANHYLEMYANIEVIATNNTSLALEVSGNDNSYLFSVDELEIRRAGTYGVNFSTHIAIPEDIPAGGTEYVFRINNLGSNDITINRVRVVLKALYL